MKRIIIAGFIFAICLFITACAANNDNATVESEPPSETSPITPSAPPLIEEEPAAPQDGDMMAFIEVAIDMLFADAPKVFIEQPASMLDYEAVAFIESIIDMFAVGTSKGEIGSALGVIPFRVIPANGGGRPLGESIYRYVLLAAPDYVYEDESDSVDLDAIYDGRLQVVAFIAYDYNDRLAWYSLYYMGEAGIRVIGDGWNSRVTGPDGFVGVCNMLGRGDRREMFEYQRSKLVTPIEYSNIEGYTVYFFEGGMRVFVDDLVSAVARVFVDHRQAGMRTHRFNGIDGGSGYNDVVERFGNDPYIIISDNYGMEQLESVKAYGYWDHCRFVVFFFDDSGGVTATYGFDSHTLPSN